MLHSPSFFKVSKPSLAGIRPKYSEATVRGNIASTHCFLNVFALAPARYVGLYGVTAPDRRVTTLPKMITNARDLSQNNPLFCLTLPLLSLPKRGAFGKVTCVEKNRLLPQMTASLYLGQVVFPVAGEQTLRDLV